MHIQIIDDIRIMPWSWWRTVALNAGLSLLNAWLARKYQNLFLGFCSGVSFTMAVTHVFTWSTFFASQERWLQHKREELKQLYRERGLTWPE